MSIIREKHSNTRINFIYQILVTEAEAGKPKEYDVRVDELKVVSLNNDPERFFTHEDFMCAETQNVTVCLYDGTSRRCTRYVLMLKEDPASAQQKEQQTLAGLEASMNEKLAQHRAQWDFEQMKKERDELKEKLDEAEEYSEELEKQVFALREEKQSSANKLTDIIVNIGGGYLMKNPSVLSGLPLIGGLLGGGNATQQPETSAVGSDQADDTETSVSFEAVKARTDQEKVADAIAPFFDPQLHRHVMSIIQHLTYYPESIPTLLKILRDLHRSETVHKANATTEDGEAEKASDSTPPPATSPAATPTELSDQNQNDDDLEDYPQAA